MCLCVCNVYLWVYIWRRFRVRWERNWGEILGIIGGKLEIERRKLSDHRDLNLNHLIKLNNNKKN